MLKIERSATNAESFRIGGERAFWVQAELASPLERYAIDIARDVLVPGGSSTICLMLYGETGLHNKEEV